MKSFIQGLLKPGLVVEVEQKEEVQSDDTCLGYEDEDSYSLAEELDLPQSQEEFDRFCRVIFRTGEMEDALNGRRYIASMIQHLGPQVFRAEIRYFVYSLKKAQANEIAFHAIQNIKSEEARVKDESLQNSCVPETAEGVVPDSAQ